MNPLNYPTDNLCALAVIAALAWVSIIIVVWAGSGQPDDKDGE